MIIHFYLSTCLDTDYSSGPYNVTIPAGYISFTLSILVIDNNVLEGQKEFYLTINQSSSLNGVVISSPQRTVVEIIDNECKQINCCYANMNDDLQ